MGSSWEVIYGINWESAGEFSSLSRQVLFCRLVSVAQQDTG